MHANVLVECHPQMKDIYYKWLKQYGAYDFIDEIVRKNEEGGFTIGPARANFLINQLDSNSISRVIGRLSDLRSRLG